MIVEIDQSIKVEQTHRDTVLAFSDGIQYRLVIPAAVKRAAIAELRSRGKYAKRLYLWLFVLALYHLLEEHWGKLTEIVIDVEYVGNEANIKGLLLHLLRGRSRRTPRTAFRRITRASRAHLAAIAVLRGHAKPDKILTRQEFLKPLAQK